MSNPTLYVRAELVAEYHEYDEHSGERLQYDVLGSEDVYLPVNDAAQAIGILSQTCLGGASIYDRYIMDNGTLVIHADLIGGPNDTKHSAETVTVHLPCPAVEGGRQWLGAVMNGV